MTRASTGTGEGRLGRRLLWFFGLYAISVVVTVVVAYGLRKVLIG